MNLTEFKAWFEGYTEEMDGAPSAKQWAKIQEKIAGITSNPTPLPLVIEKYREYIPWWKEYPRPYYGLSGVQIGDCAPIMAPGVITCGTYKYDTAVARTLTTTDFSALPQNAIDAYRDVGRYDAKALDLAA